MHPCIIVRGVPNHKPMWLTHKSGQRDRAIGFVAPAMGDFEIDELFCFDFSGCLDLPLPFANHIDFSKCNAKTSHDARRVAEHLSTLARGSNSQGPSNVMKLDLMDCGLNLMDQSAWRLVRGALQSMEHLCVVNIERSGLAGEKIAELLYTLLQLHAMQGNGSVAGDPSARPSRTAEISIRSNECEDSVLSQLLSKNDRHLARRPARGVRKLVLSDNRFSDSALACATALVPQLDELHVSGNVNYRGTHLSELVCDRFAPLTLIGLDRTGIDAKGIASLQGGLARRASKADAPHLEIWMRMPANPQDATWGPLLEFCLQPKCRPMFTLKHDMQKSTCHAQQRVATHENIVVRLFINGWTYVDVNHFDTPATASVNAVAKVAVSEVNLLSNEHVSRAPSRAAAELRKRYAEALRPICRSSALAGKVLKVSVARMLTRNKFTNETKVLSVTGSEIIGRPVSGWEPIIEVVTEEDSDCTPEVTKLAPR